MVTRNWSREKPTTEGRQEQVEFYRNVIDGKSIAFLVILLAWRMLVSMDTASTKKKEKMPLKLVFFIVLSGVQDEKKKHWPILKWLCNRPSWSTECWNLAGEET